MSEVAVSLSIEIDVNNHTSETVDEMFFGGNFGHHKDEINDIYTKKINDLGIEFIRYPGGSETERTWDITDPDSEQTTQWGDTVKLTDFLQFCKDNGVKPIIAIPTMKYVGDVDRGVEELQQFIEDITSGVYGDVEIYGFEIGNEYFVDLGVDGLGPLSPDQYGEISSAFATTIKNSAQYDVKVSVQAGYHEWENVIIASYFDTEAEISAVDMISIHNYAFSYDGIENRIEDKVSRAELWEQMSGRDLDIFMSEWAMKSYRPADLNREKHIYGLAQASMMLENAKEAIEAGVDIATYWAVQQGTRNALSEVNAEELRITGEMFKMMEKSITGTQVLDTESGISGSDKFVAHAFEDDSKIVLFVSARGIRGEAYDLDLELDMLGFDSSEISNIWIEHLTTDENPELEKSKPIVAKYTPEAQITDNVINMDLHFKTHYDVVKIVINKVNPGDIGQIYYDTNSSKHITTGFGDDFIEANGGDDVVHSLGGDDYISLISGNNYVYSGFGNDSVVGGSSRDVVYLGRGSDNFTESDGKDLSGRDLVFGGRGSDSISTGSGRDRALGGAGDDIISGGRGRDIVNGGLGSDWLAGEKGKDILRGGSGDDVIAGGYGDDTLIGGSGSDVFVFEPGHGRDMIVDFQNGEDRIAMVGLSGGFESLSIEDLGEGRICVYYTDDDYFVMYSDVVSIEETDFLFL